jgi:hypothetical protein
MLEVGEAVNRAKVYLSEIMPEFVQLQPQVDEMEFSEVPKAWKITFVARLNDTAKSDSLADVVRRRVVQKVVEVGANDGAFISVKNFSF